MSVDALFEPLTLGPWTLPNRVVMAPMTRSQSPGGVPTAAVAEYYRQRAAGGVGLIITEGTTVDHPGSNGYPRVPRFYGDESLAGWRRVVDAVHGEGGRIVPQLWHVGSFRQTGMEPDPSAPGYGPSAVVHPGRSKDPKAETPRAMTDEDIADVIGAFGRAAAAARRTGFDGVEIHGAHGYLLDQFFWSETNQREDRWGGSLEARARFGVEVARACRAALGPRLPLILRFSQWKLGAYQAQLADTPAELERFLAPFVDAGVDVFHCSQRRFWEPAFDGEDTNLAGWTRKLTGKPTITVGSVGLDTDFIASFGGADASANGIDQLLERLVAKEFDLVAIGRALISDPGWPEKVQRSAWSEVIPFDRAHLSRL